MGEIHNHLREIHKIGPRTKERLIDPSTCPGLARHRIIFTGISEAAEGFEWIRLAPRMAQLLVSVQGRGEVLHNGRWKPIREGVAYITYPLISHGYRAVGPGRWHVCWVMFDGADAPYGLGRPRAPALRRTDPRLLFEAISGLHVEVSAARDPACLQLWSNLVDAYTRRVLSGSKERLWKLWDAVARDLARTWSLEAMAQAAGMGSEQLRRLCHAETGRSPMKHLTHLRMQHACALLGTDLKISAIASAVGYDNPFAFSTAFKRTVGREPSFYRSHPDQPDRAGRAKDNGADGTDSNPSELDL